MRLRMNVLDSRLPIPWLRLGVAKPPISADLVEVKLARAFLSNPITLTGLSDLWIWQDKIVVEILDNAVLKGILRKISAQNGSTEGLIFKVILKPLFNLWDCVTLDITKNEELKKGGDGDFKHSPCTRKLPSTVPIAGTSSAIPSPTTAAFTNDLDSLKKPLRLRILKSIQQSNWGVKTPTQKMMDTVTNYSAAVLQLLHDRFIGSSDSYILPVIPWRDPGPEGVFPGIKPNRQPVDTSMTGLSTGLSLTFARPPSLQLRLGTVSFDIHLNGSIVASAAINGIEFRHDSTRADILIEVIPSMMKRPIRGLLSSARGVLRGALNGAVSGLINGEWGSGSTVLRIVNLRIEDEIGAPVLWVMDVIEALDLEHDLDAFGRLGGAAKGAAKDVRDSVFEITAGLIAAGGSRCSIL
ncbi:hypothetical protein BC829DRAFT_389339 [Chytridium lagenaria]|nr:hypothetical protein BC829DRAFT_389339 [Chytridium lagenaria]